ncbi:ComEC/Rec2 family competence protein [Ochrovirga pacifica]|uniref:ComEC/Rec2 family competence protein n=1 Tax=Ochrovirga pacifica TaxID=1042376 RepID=UPI0002557BDC|nr:MBL fold metallo-hydrolase [Ochrovirga pacifica]
MQYKKLEVFIVLFCTSFLVNAQKLELPVWQEGFLDIHHIHTGRGDAAFVVMPDGTTMLIDAGDMSETHARTHSPRNAKLMPNASKTAPQWIVDYIQQFAPNQQKTKLDYALITHYHDDHFGEVDTLRTIAKGGYQLTGITEVGTMLSIKKMIDRGYTDPIDLKDSSIQSLDRYAKDKYQLIPTLKEYWKFIEHQEKKGMKHETLNVGEKKQIVLTRKPDSYPDFSIQNIASNGVIWTGVQNKTYRLFAKGSFPNENALSNCIRIDYGPFNYFTGGDISGIDGLGQMDLDAVESHVAPVIGAVDVATLNHHGNRDSQNPYYVRTLRPRVWIQQNWTADHPGEEVLRRITSKALYPGERDLFSTVMLRGAKEVIGGQLDQYKSQKGHVVVRVAKGGSHYKIYVLNDASETREVLSEFGPYISR